MAVEISMALHARLLALAAADPAREVCGVLLGRDQLIAALVEARNVADDPARTFEIDPRAQIDAIKAGRAGALPVIGCYHSHPSGVAVPSARDRAMAEPGSVWLIIGGGQITAWFAATTGFESAELRVVHD